MTDLLARCAELVDVASVSHAEAALADRIEVELRDVPWLRVERVGENVVARTELGRPARLVLAGHIDTVPPNGNDRARIDGDVLWGVGAADMKAGVTVFLELARTLDAPAVDVSYVFYACEEVAQEHNGLTHLLRDRPELLAGDAAVLGEPTGARIEAGCQGSMRVDVSLSGERAHTARPWMGRNAVHRLGPVLQRLGEYEERRPVLAGCEFREALQAVAVEGGVAGNVVPDRAVVRLNHRFAPDRDAETALAHLRAFVGDTLDETSGDSMVLVDSAAPAPPSVDHPLLASLVAATGHAPRAKLGWTDVSLFASAGIPALNYGPGDPALAHSAAERVERSEIDAVHVALRALLGGDG